jgi:hypothetical protein
MGAIIRLTPAWTKSSQDEHKGTPHAHEGRSRQSYETALARRVGRPPAASHCSKPPRVIGGAR